MSRTSWFDNDTALAVIDEQAAKLETFVEAMADGIIEAHELAKQQESVAAVMRQVEGQLDDAQHELVTRLLVELSAYNVMRVLHELHQQRLHRTVGDRPGH